MTIVPNVRILAAMGRWCYGLVFVAAFVAGCASAAAPDEHTQMVGDNFDLAGVDLAGGMVVDNCMPNQACQTTNPGDGAVKPAAQEDCFNDLDDDCDGVVNNGCPDHLTTGTPHLLTARGNTGGG